MNYPDLLKTQLLSKSNIDYLINLILSNFRISRKAVDKCTHIIESNFNRYLTNLERYPANNSELIEAIKFLNKKCYDDFTIYLLNKYPQTNLYRTQPPSQLVSQQPQSQLVSQQPQSYQPQSQQQSHQSQS